jgi:transcriptional regulator with XRE-family HTH domain
MFIHQNLKILRQRKGITQVDASKRIGLSRSQLAGYETHIKPTLDALILIADFFGISSDALLRLDFSKISELKLRELEEGNSQFSRDYLKGKNLRVLTTTLDTQGKELTELVPLKAKAGYLNGYADPEYIGELESIHLPFLSKNGKHRIFQLEGDSMPPHAETSYVVCSYLEDWLTIKNGRKYVVLTTTEGIVFKILYNQLPENGSVLLSSTNPEYEPFSVKGEEILEIWKYEYSIGQ